MSKLKRYRRSCPFVMTVIIDHKCFGLYKRHSRRWWRNWWRHHRREWWRHHRHCPFLIFLWSLWCFCAWTLVISLLCCCCKRRCKRRVNNYVDEFCHVQNQDGCGITMRREGSFKTLVFHIPGRGNDVQQQSMMQGNVGYPQP